MAFFNKNKALEEQEEGKPKEGKAKEAHQGNNPYINGRDEWAERYGSYIKRTHNWQIVTVISLIITVLSITGNVIQAGQIKIIPYIIEVDKLGRASVVSRADTMGVAPQRLVQSVIGTCISDWRTVTADVELQKKMITRLSFFFAGTAKGILKEWFSISNPYDIAKSGKLIHVELKSLPLPITANSYRIEWLEITRNHSGVIVDTQRYEATITIQTSTPKSEAVLIHNPGGIYITNIAVSKILNQIS